MAGADVTGADVDDVVSPREQRDMAREGQSFSAIKDSLESLDLRADPDAQATVTDFLDFTEYLPSDMMRSLTLVGGLDQTYIDASTKVHHLTTTWGQLPNMAPEERPVPAQLRADISESLTQAVSSRIYSHAEAVRMAENVNRHYNRARTILAKLKTMRDNYPPPEEQKSPVTSKSPQMMRAPKITLRVEGGGNQKLRRQRVPRITVPGEVLAPYELNYESYSDDSDESSDDDDDESLPRATPAAQTRIKLVKSSKTPKIRVPKPIHTPLSQLKPPPENAAIGSADAPWLQLTPYELAKLRKRMKKNAQWIPSETMVARELKILSRGLEAWKVAKRQAEEEGRAFENTLPQPIIDSDGVAHPPLGALSIDAALAAEDKQNSNRGMKLNEAKKLKKENLAQLAAKEAEESARKMEEQVRAMKSQLNAPMQTAPKAVNTKTPSQPKKRKRENGSEADIEGSEPSTQRSQQKRTKTETPVPIPQPTPSSSSGPAHATPVHPPQLTAGGTGARPKATTPVPVPIPGQEQPAAEASKSSSPSVNGGSSSGTLTTTVPIKPPAETPIPPPLQSPKKSTTPIFPPMRETRTREAARKEQQKDSQPPPPTAKPVSRPTTPAAEASRRPPSRGAKAMSQEPQQPSLAADRPRRASTARNTPAPEPRPAAKRPKRPAPGVISRTNSGGNSAVGRRKAPPKKKRGAQKKDKAEVEVEVEVEVDDDGNVIDEDEPKYCLCNRVSFGTMIQCDNIDNCKHEWFHLECVDLAEIPARTTKWYCPDCRILLGIGNRGEVNARGVKM